MAKKLHPLALKATECFFAGDLAGWRRFRRELGTKVPKREMRRQMDLASAEVRRQFKQRAQLSAT